MVDPGEGKWAKRVRWTFWIIVGSLFAIYKYDSDPNGFWETLQFMAVAIGAYFAVTAVVVEPLQANIRALEYKIDDLRRRKG